MPVYYGFARWSYDEDTVHVGRATVVPRNKPVLFRSPVRPGESRRFLKKKFETTGATSQGTPVQHGESRFNAVFAGVATVWSRWAPVFTP